MATPAPGRSPLARYLTAQVPGWIIVAIGAVVASSYGADPKLAWTIAGAWVFKDLVAYPFVRRAYERGRTATEALVGEVGVVRDALAPIYALEPEGGLTAELPYAEIQCAIDDPPGFRNYWSASHLASLLAVDFNRATLAAKKLPYERLDQLTIEVLLGVR